MGSRGAFVASAVLGASILAGCGNGDEGPAVDGTSAAPPTSATSTAPSTSATPAASTSGSATGLHPDSGARPDGWPPEAPPEHGGQVWAVYLAVGASGDPELAEAAQYLKERGYSAGEQELGCDVDAADALARDPRDHAVAVYFEWRDEAGDFLTLLKPAGSPEESRGFVEMLRVTRGCMD